MYMYEEQRQNMHIDIEAQTANLVAYTDSPNVHAQYPVSCSRQGKASLSPVRGPVWIP